MSNNFKYAGTHLLIEFWDNVVPEDPAKLSNVLHQAALHANSEPLKVAVHKFEPRGITAVIILAESHISVHYWPEIKYTSIDIFTCGDHSMPHKALEYLKKEFSPQRVEVQEIGRGKLSEEMLQTIEKQIASVTA